jgi:hypothetical protein
MKTPAQVEQFLDQLFTNGAGDEAARLVLTSEEGRGLGGWSRSAVRDLLMRTLVDPAGSKSPKRRDK